MNKSFNYYIHDVQTAEEEKKKAQSIYDAHFCCQSRRFGGEITSAWLPDGPLTLGVDDDAKTILLFH